MENAMQNNPSRAVVEGLALLFLLLTFALVLCATIAEQRAWLLMSTAFIPLLANILELTRALTGMKGSRCEVCCKAIKFTMLSSDTTGCSWNIKVVRTSNPTSGCASQLPLGWDGSHDTFEDASTVSETTSSSSRCDLIFEQAWCLLFASILASSCSDFMNLSVSCKQARTGRKN
jgi:putative effector of murein hydrolase LrgA (UPF0299 family)